MQSEDQDFIPCPSFSLRRNLKLPSSYQNNGNENVQDEEFSYSFKFTNQFLSNAQDLDFGLNNDSEI